MQIIVTCQTRTIVFINIVQGVLHPNIPPEVEFLMLDALSA